MVVVAPNRSFFDQELRGGKEGAALAHRNTLPPKHHIPVGVSSDEVTAFEQQMEADDPEALAAQFPADTISGW